MDTASTALLFTPEIEELTRAMERHLSPPATSARFFMVLGAIVISVGMSALGVESRINDVIVGGSNHVRIALDLCPLSLGKT
jgi:hypothetical protein